MRSGGVMKRAAWMIPALVLAWAVHPPSASAQEVISTDRPGLGLNPGTVANGAFQVELGLPRVDETGLGDDPAYGLDAAIRVGVAERVEARLSTTLYTRTPAAPGMDGPTGIAGLRTGVKIGVLTGSKLSLALVPEVVLPVGNDALAGDRAAYSVQAAAGVPMAGSSLVLVAGAQLNPSGKEDYQTTGLLVAVLGRPFTSAIAGYVEAGALPGPGEDAAYVGLGATWLPLPRVQLDGFADFGMTDAASNAIFGLGLSFLIH